MRQSHNQSTVHPQRHEGSWHEGEITALWAEAGLPKTAKDLWVVFDRPNNNDLDILLTLVPRITEGVEVKLRLL